MSDFCTSKEVVTRKPHQCEWCAGPIPVGEKCWHAKGAFDGSMYDYHMHAECWDGMDCYDYQDGFMPGCGEMPERVKLLEKS